MKRLLPLVCLPLLAGCGPPPCSVRPDDHDLTRPAQVAELFRLAALAPECATVAYDQLSPRLRRQVSRAEFILYMGSRDAEPLRRELSRAAIDPRPVPQGPDRCHVRVASPDGVLRVRMLRLRGRWYIDDDLQQARAGRPPP